MECVGRGGENARTLLTTAVRSAHDQMFGACNHKTELVRRKICSLLAMRFVLTIVRESGKRSRVQTDVQKCEFHSPEGQRL